MMNMFCMCCRGKVQAMVDDLCRGVEQGDMMAAFQGLLAAEPHVRAVAVTALPRIPLLSQGMHPLPPMPGHNHCPSLSRRSGSAEMIRMSTAYPSCPQQMHPCLPCQGTITAPLSSERLAQEK